MRSLWLIAGVATVGGAYACYKYWLHSRNMVPVEVVETVQDAIDDTIGLEDPEKDAEGNIIATRIRPRKAQVWKHIAKETVAEVGFLSDTPANRLVVSRVCRDLMRERGMIRVDIATHLGACIEFYYSNVVGRETGRQVAAVLGDSGLKTERNWTTKSLLEVLLTGRRVRSTGY